MQIAACVVTGILSLVVLAFLAALIDCEIEQRRERKRREREHRETQNLGRGEELCET